MPNWYTEHKTYKTTTTILTYKEIFKTPQCSISLFCKLYFEHGNYLKKSRILNFCY